VAVWYANERLALRLNYGWHDEEVSDIDDNEFLLQLGIKFQRSGVAFGGARVQACPRRWRHDQGQVTP
jgi:hypothetical protein